MTNTKLNKTRSLTIGLIHTKTLFVALKNETNGLGTKTKIRLKKESKAIMGLGKYTTIAFPKRVKALKIERDAFFKEFEKAMNNPLNGLNILIISVLKEFRSK